MTKDELASKTIDELYTIFEGQETYLAMLETKINKNQESAAQDRRERDKYWNAIKESLLSPTIIERHHE